MDKYKILFVDDEPHVTAALVRAMRHEPWETFNVDSAKAGLELLAREEINVVVSDEQMPGMRGSEFLTLVREKYPDTIRIILTGQASVEATIRAINEAGVYRFITKPCDALDLKATIRQALQQKQLVGHTRKLLQNYQEQAAMVEEIEEATGILNLNTDGEGAILVDDIEGDLDDLLREMGS